MEVDIERAKKYEQSPGFNSAMGAYCEHFHAIRAFIDGLSNWSTANYVASAACLAYAKKTCKLSDYDADSLAMVESNEYQEHKHSEELKAIPFCPSCGSIIVKGSFLPWRKGRCYCRKGCCCCNCPRGH